MEITANSAQTVAVNQIVAFDNTPIWGSCSILHRDGSGNVKLRGITAGQCRARFKVYFNGNIAAVTSAAAISIAIAIDGEPSGAATMIVTPAAINEYMNVSASLVVDVPAGCCSIVNIVNTSTQSISVENANLIVERIA